MKGRRTKCVRIISASIIILALASSTFLLNTQSVPKSKVIPDSSLSVSNSVSSTSVSQPEEPSNVPMPQPAQPVVENEMSIEPDLGQKNTDSVQTQPDTPIPPTQHAPSSTPQDVDGMIDVPGFGWIADEDVGGAGTVTGSDGDPNKQIGEM